MSDRGNDKHPCAVHLMRRLHQHLLVWKSKPRSRDQMKTFELEIQQFLDERFPDALGRQAEERIAFDSTECEELFEQFRKWRERIPGAYRLESLPEVFRELNEARDFFYQPETAELMRLKESHVPNPDQEILDRERNRRERQSQAGKKRGQRNKERDEKIASFAKEQLAKGDEEYKSIVSTLAERYTHADSDKSLCAARIRQILKKAGIYPPRRRNQLLH